MAEALRRCPSRAGSRSARGRCRDDDRLLVGLGAQRHRVPLALGPDLARFLLALGLHPPEDGLAVGGAAGRRGIVAGWPSCYRFLVS